MKVRMIISLKINDDSKRTFYRIHCLECTYAKKEYKSKNYPRILNLNINK